MPPTASASVVSAKPGIAHADGLRVRHGAPSLGSRKASARFLQRIRHVPDGRDRLDLR